ncbi:hypothetical protein [Haliangium sp.]|uniref:hypothetical protein n=1 Tax=Haliangium sp. TaxID=2663208 RepID=UPI003D126F65
MASGRWRGRAAFAFALAALGALGAVGCGGDDAADASASCDPLTGDGCAVGEKCSLRVEREQPYRAVVECVADGDVAPGGACGFGDPGPSGTDDCRAGSFCLDGACQRVCDLAVSGCAAGACIRYEGVFEGRGLGVCTPACAPLAGDGDGDGGCGEGRGCYLALDTGVATCHPVGSATQDQVCGFIDSCAPGLGCVLSAPGGDGSVCTAMCDPGTGATAAGGSCVDALGASAGTPRCVRINRFYSDTPLVDDGLGMCVDCSVAEYAAFAVCSVAGVGSR